uniref:Putative secreted protein n=1 Tax=Anopheles darlingi TaxID=43151 RepID=A0A2M4D047_ANODA
MVIVAVLVVLRAAAVAYARPRSSRLTMASPFGRFGSLRRWQNRPRRKLAPPAHAILPLSSNHVNRHE